MKIIFLFLVTILSWNCLSGQQLTAVATQWNDSFAEWIIYTSVEGEEGTLRLRWSSQGDWTQWDYRIGEWTGKLKTKWPERIDQWEARGENIIIDARTIWRDNFREWRISRPGGEEYKWQSRYSNVLDEWVVDSEKYGYFEMYTAFAGDPREWIIVDELDASLPEKMMLVFLTIINSTPKQ